MANIKKIILNGTTYNIVDSTAVHTVDTAISSSSTNPVQNKVIKAALDKKGTLISLSTATATALLDYYSFSVPAADITAINAAHDGVIISFGSSSAFGANETFVGFLNETTLWNGITYLAYSGTISAATSLDSNLFVLLLPKTGNGGTGYIKAKNVATKGDVGDALDNAEDYADTKIVAAIEALDAAVSGLGTGKTITALSETNGVISATASNISIAGSQVTSGNIAAARMPTGYMKEAYLEWGGKNFSCNNGPLDAALINNLGANRFAFIPGDCITVEYSTDAGATWTDYGWSNGEKTGIFAPGIGTATYLGKHSSTGGSANDQLRITVDTYTTKQWVYSTIKKMCVFLSTNGASGMKWTCQVRTTANVLNNVDTWGDVFRDVNISGYSGINITQTDVIIGSNVPTSTSNTQYRQFRYIFTQAAAHSSGRSAYISYIMGFGGVGWNTPSNMAKVGSIYNYDRAQNATFPARVKATELKGLGANYYGTCSTAAGTAAKVVTCTDFVLVAGARISVKFTNGSTSTGTMQLNVNDTGAKSCVNYLYNDSPKGDGFNCEKNEILEFVYDGTYWVAQTEYYLRNSATNAARPADFNTYFSGRPNSGLQYTIGGANTANRPADQNAALIHAHWDTSGYDMQLGIVPNYNNNVGARLFSRAQLGTGSGWSEWKEFPRLSSSLTNGQIVVSDESTGQALLKGITYDYKLTLSTTFTDVDADTISFSLSNDQLTGLNDYMSSAVSGGYTGMVHVSFTAPLPNSDTHEAVYIAHSALLDEYDMKWVFSGTVYDSVDKTTYPFTFSYPIASTGPVTATVKLNRASGGGSLDPVEDTDAFLSRQVNFGENKYKFPSLVGGTVAWNQLAVMQASSTSGTSNGVTFTDNRDGSFTLNGTATASFNRGIIQQISVIKTHIYFVGVSDQVCLTDSQGYSTKKGNRLLQATSSANRTFQLYVTTGSAYSNLKIYPQVIDLTLALGPTIADYIYSLETATAGAGANWFKQYFPKSYYPYNAGALISVNPTGAETVGFNLFDISKKTDNRLIAWANGNLVTENKSVVSDYISIIPGEKYYCNYKAQWGCYDSNYTYIGAIRENNVISPSVGFETNAVMIPANYGVAFIRLGIRTGSNGSADMTTNTDINLNLFRDGSKNGDYVPYTHHSYPISPVELRGIPKLTDGKLAFDGDVRASDGTVTRKYGIVDMGTLTIGFNNQAYSIFKVTMTGMQAPATDADRLTGIKSSKYPVDTVAAINASMGNKTMKRAGSDIYIRDTAYTTVADFKTAMSGVYLVYELATPTTESSATLPVPQVVYDGGTESYIDERDVQVPVAQNATYMDATNAIGELMDSGLVPSSGGGASYSEGTFTAKYGTVSNTWNYYKEGNTVTVWGSISNATSMAAAVMTGLPFAARHKQVVSATCSGGSYICVSMDIRIESGSTQFAPSQMTYASTSGTSVQVMNSETMIFYTIGNTATLRFTYICQ